MLNDKLEQKYQNVQWVANVNLYSKDKYHLCGDDDSYFLNVCFTEDHFIRSFLYTLHRLYDAIIKNDF